MGQCLGTFILVWTQENTNLNISTNSSLVQLWKDTEALKQHSYSKQTELDGLTVQSFVPLPPCLSHILCWMKSRETGCNLSQLG